MGWDGMGVLDVRSCPSTVWDGVGEMGKVIGVTLFCFFLDRAGFHNIDSSAQWNFGEGEACMSPGIIEVARTIG